MNDLAEVHFCVPAPAAAAVESYLLDTFGHGIEQRDAETLAQPDSGQVEFVCWVAPDDVQGRVADLERFLGTLRELGTVVEPFTWREEPTSSEGWVEAYRKHFQLTRIGRRFVIKPTWEDYEPLPRDRVIELEPGMAFGTGLHASTKLALSGLERIERHGWDPPHNVLDVGCGTGVLAIAAIRMWHRCRALAIDSDETAVGVCRENVERNGVSPRIRVEQQSAAEVGGRYDLIMANLSYDLLKDLFQCLRKGLTNNGRLVLSGLLADQATAISRQYGRDLTLEPEYTEEQDGWRAIVLRAIG